MECWLIINYKEVMVDRKYMIFQNRLKALAYAQGIGWPGQLPEVIGFKSKISNHAIDMEIIKLEVR